MVSGRFYSNLFPFNGKMDEVHRGLRCTKVQFALLTQQPLVRFSAIPKPYGQDFLAAMVKGKLTAITLIEPIWH